MIAHPYKGNTFKNDQDPTQRHSNDVLRQLFYSMLRIRLIEEAIEARYNDDQMKTPIHLSIGQEAISVGGCAALNYSDLIYCSHRSHGPYLAKGGNINAMFSELHCRTNGCAGSRGGSMHLLDKAAGVSGGSAIVAGAIPIAAGAALCAKMKKKPSVICAFFGDAATEEGVFWETLNFAALKKLPIIFLCENNYYSVCTPIEKRQPNVPLYKKAEAFGIAANTVDGTHVLAMYETMQEAKARALAGDGATFIEAHAYRWRGHHGAGDDSHTGYRDPNEVTQWQQSCPVQTYYDHLQQWDILDEKQHAKMQATIEQEIQAAFEHAENSPMPDEQDLYQHVYATE